jgi:hypothetical protein
MEGETAWERSAWSHAHEMSPESVEKRSVRHVEQSPTSAEKRGCSVEFGRNGEGSVVHSVVKSCSKASGGGGLSEMVWGRLLEAQLKDMEESIRLVCRSSSPPGHTYAYAYAYAVCVCSCRIWRRVSISASSARSHTYAYAYAYAYAVCVCSCRIWRRVRIYIYISLVCPIAYPRASYTHLLRILLLQRARPTHPAACSRMLTDSDVC